MIHEGVDMPQCAFPTKWMAVILFGSGENTYDSALRECCV
jgi:hypothetical protein